MEKTNFIVMLMPRTYEVAKKLVYAKFFAMLLVIFYLYYSITENYLIFILNFSHFFFFFRTDLLTLDIEKNFFYNFTYSMKEFNLTR